MCSTGLGGQRTVPKELFRDFRKTKIGNHCVGKARFRYEGKRPNYLVHRHAASDKVRHPVRPERASKAAAGPRQPTTRHPYRVQATRTGSYKDPPGKAAATRHWPRRPGRPQRPPPSPSFQPTIVRTRSRPPRKPLQPHQPAARPEPLQPHQPAAPLQPHQPVATSAAAPPMAASSSALQVLLPDGIHRPGNPTAPPPHLQGRRPLRNGRPRTKHPRHPGANKPLPHPV